MHTCMLVQVQMYICYYDDKSEKEHKWWKKIIIIMKKGKIYILNNINRMRVRGSERIIINK